MCEFKYSSMDHTDNFPTKIEKESHYDWLNKHMPSFAKHLGLTDDSAFWESIAIADGDKCYSYEDQWMEAGIPFEHGVAIYLLSKFDPYQDECRNTKNGWVPVERWVIDNYEAGHRFKDILNKI